MVTKISKHDSPNTVKMKQTALVLREGKAVIELALRWINLVCNAKSYKKPQRR